MKKLLIGFTLGIGLVLGGISLSNATLSADELDPVVETTEETETIQAFAEAYGIEFFKAAAILKIMDAEEVEAEELLALTNEALLQRLREVYASTEFERPALDPELATLMESLMETYDIDPGTAMKITLISGYTDATVDELLALSDDELTALFEAVNEEGLLPTPGSLMRDVMGGIRRMFDRDNFQGRGRGAMHRGSGEFEHRLPNDDAPDLDIPDTEDSDSEQS